MTSVCHTGVDTSDPGQFGPKTFRHECQLSGHIGTSPELYYGHSGTKENTSARGNSEKY